MDYQGNSHKSKEEKEPIEPPPEKHLVKITTSEVVQRKKPFGHKLKTIFLGGEFKDVVSYITYDVILPGARDVIFDTIKNGAQRAIYGYRGPGPSYSRQPVRSQVQYNNPVRRMSDPRHQQSASLPRQGPVGYQQNRREVNDVVFSSREDAAQVLDTMINCVEMYGVVSLADLYELVGLPQSHIDQKWGWTHVTSTEIRQIRDGYLLELPPMEEL
jgi:hypothetical protein